MLGRGARGAGRGLRIPKGLYDQIIAHCRSSHPKEACGILASLVVAGGPIIRMYPMTNVEDSAIGYSMEPKEQLQVEKQMRERAERMCGIYHSHTASPAYPSPVDVSLAISPDISYVVVSLERLDSPDFRSYRITGAHVVEEHVEVEGLAPWARQR